MEKLIELLNEYGTQEEIKWKWYFVPNHIQWEGCDNSECSDLLIISKKFGFIKWLVENKKIDFDKCGLDVRHYLSYNKRYDKGIVMAKNYDNDTFVVEEFYSPYEQLLMLLAIQDEPIRFLCEILK